MADIKTSVRTGAVVDTKLEESNQADTTAFARRVILIDGNGDPIPVTATGLKVDTEITLDGNLIIDNVVVFATDIADSTTAGFALIDSSGHLQIDVLTLPDVVIAAVNDTPEVFEDTSFVSGDSPVTLDCNTELGRNARQFSIQNDGLGDFTVSISNDGDVFGDEKTVKNGEVYAISDISVDSIRITHVADSAYRVTVI